MSNMEGKRVVAICGTAGTSRQEIFDQPAEVELWGLNHSYKWMPRLDRLFELHDPIIYAGAFPEAHRDWLRSATVPVYMQQAHAEYPTSVAYPASEVLDEGRLRPNFTSSIAYMLALAVHERVDEIRLLGANMATGSEYAYQRAAVEYWIGVAEARGITVYLPPSCPLTKGPRYGAVGASADLVRAIVDTREAAKVQLEQTFAEFVDFVRAQADLPPEIAEKLRETELTVAGCRGAVQVLDRVSQGQQAVRDDGTGVEPGLDVQAVAA